MSSHKVYNKINESPQIHLEAYNVLLDSSNNLKTVIKEYKILMEQREEIVAENYDILIVKHNDYDSTKVKKLVALKLNIFIHLILANEETASFTKFRIGRTMCRKYKALELFFVNIQRKNRHTTIFK